MKVVVFKIPKVERESFRYQVDTAARFYDQLHQHDEIQVMFIEQGEGTLIAGDYVGRFSSNELYIIGSGQPHVFRSDQDYFKMKTKLKSKSVSIYFNEKYWGESFWQLEEMKTVRKFSVRAARGLQVTGKPKDEAIELIHQLKNASGIERLILFLSLLKKLAETKKIKPLAVSSSNENFKTEEGKRMNEIMQFTFQQSHRKIYLDEVASIANLSVEAFCRYFKMHTRKTFTSFLNEVRVSNACQLLINKDLSVQEIGYRSGFNNISNFNRIFKRITGKKPSAYLK